MPIVIIKRGTPKSDKSPLKWDPPILTTMGFINPGSTLDELGSLNMLIAKIRFKEVVILETFRANITANVWGAPFWVTHTLFNVNLCVHVCVPFVQTFMFSLGKQDSQIDSSTSMVQLKLYL